MADDVFKFSQWNFFSFDKFFTVRKGPIDAIFSFDV